MGKYTRGTQPAGHMPPADASYLARTRSGNALSPCLVRHRYCMNYPVLSKHLLIKVTCGQICYRKLSTAVCESVFGVVNIVHRIKLTEVLINCSHLYNTAARELIRKGEYNPRPRDGNRLCACELCCSVWIGETERLSWTDPERGKIVRTGGEAL